MKSREGIRKKGKSAEAQIKMNSDGRLWFEGLDGKPVILEGDAEKEYERQQANPDSAPAAGFPKFDQRRMATQDLPEDIGESPPDTPRADEQKGGVEIKSGLRKAQRQGARQSRDTERPRGRRSRNQQNEQPRQDRHPSAPDDDADAAPTDVDQRDDTRGRKETEPVEIMRKEARSLIESIRDSGKSYMQIKGIELRDALNRRLKNLNDVRGISLFINELQGVLEGRPAGSGRGILDRPADEPALVRRGDAIGIRQGDSVRSASPEEIEKYRELRDAIRRHSHIADEDRVRGGIHEEDRDDALGPDWDPDSVPKERRRSEQPRAAENVNPRETYVRGVTTPDDLREMLKRHFKGEAPRRDDETEI